LRKAACDDALSRKLDSNQSSIVSATASAASTLFLSASFKFDGVVSMVTLMILPVNLYLPACSRGTYRFIIHACVDDPKLE
jgi:hypothetical protein